MQDEKNALQDSEVAKKKEKNKKLIYLIITLIACVALLFIYRTSLEFRFFPIVLWGYMISLMALVIAYIVYNRGFSRKGITKDMLPDDWSEEEKRKFVDSAKKRLERSKWMLILIIAFLFTFLFDALELFVLSNIFK